MIQPKALHSSLSTLLPHQKNAGFSTKLCESLILQFDFRKNISKRYILASKWNDLILSSNSFHYESQVEAGWNHDNSTKVFRMKLIIPVRNTLLSEVKISQYDKSIIFFNHVLDVSR